MTDARSGWNFRLTSRGWSDRQIANHLNDAAMGEGRIVWKTGKLPPTPVKPKTPAEIIYKIACGSAASG